MRFRTKVASSFAQQIRVGFLLVAQGIGGLISIIVATVNHRGIRQLFNFFQRLIQRLRTAITQVRTTTAVNEHGIAGHQMVTHIKALPTKWNGQALLKC